MVIKKFSRRVRTLYECAAEHDNELSFLPGQIITNGTYIIFDEKNRKN